MERLDSWSEVTLGLCSTCVVTVVLIASCFALFELGVMPWVHSWEGPVGNTTTATTTTSTTTFTTTATTGTSSAPEVTMAFFKEQVGVAAPGGFAEIAQKGHKDRISFSEFTAVANKFSPPLPLAKEKWAFQFFDCNHDGKIFENEWDAAMAADEFYDGNVDCPSTTTKLVTSATTTVEATTTTLKTTTTIKKTTTLPPKPMGELETIWTRINKSHLKIVRKNCADMDLEGTQGEKDAGIAFDEFQAYFQLKADLSTKETEDLFRVVDLNDNKKISQAECKFRIKNLQKMIEGLGSATTVVTDLDMDGDKLLDAKEFGHVGDMLYLDNDQPIGSERTKVWYYRLNKDGMPGLSAAELNFSMPPTPAPPPGLVGPTTTAMPVKAGTEALTPEELKQYEGVPAIIQGRTELKLEVPINLVLPADAQMGQVLWHDLVKTSFDQIMNSNLKINSKDVYHKSEAQLAAEGVEKTVETKYLTFSWEVDVPDGGVFQERLVQKAKRITKTLLKHLKKSGIPWLAQSEALMHARITAEYYGMKAIGLPRGNAIVQHFGKEKGEDLDGSAPYTLASITSRRLGSAPTLVV